MGMYKVSKNGHSGHTQGMRLPQLKDQWYTRAYEQQSVQSSDRHLEKSNTTHTLDHEHGSKADPAQKE